jgi:hypothetical protein
MKAIGIRLRNRRRLGAVQSEQGSGAAVLFQDDRQRRKLRAWRLSQNLERPRLSDEAIGFLDGQSGRRAASGENVRPAEKRGDQHDENDEPANHKTIIEPGAPPA